MRRIDHAVETNQSNVAQVAAGQAQVETSKAQIEAAGAAVKAAEAGLETAKVNLGFTKLTSLIDGIAGGISVWICATALDGVNGEEAAECGLVGAGAHLDGVAVGEFVLLAVVPGVIVFVLVAATSIWLTKSVPPAPRKRAKKL